MIDTRFFDRPSAILRGTGVGMDRMLLDELVRWGYDVHFPVGLMPAVAEVPHPRLHPGYGPGSDFDDADGVLPGTLAESIGDRGSPLALIVCARPCDVTVQLSLLSRFMSPLRCAGLLVVDSSPQSRSASPALLPATLDQRILISTVSAAGDPAWVRRCMAWALEQMLARVTR